MISIPSSVLTALNSTAFRSALLVDAPGTTFQVTDNHKAITYNGVTYKVSDELLMKTSNISRTTNIAANGYQITVSGADTSAIQEYTDNDHLGKTATVYMAFLDDNYELLATDSVLEVYQGLVEGWSLDEGATSSEFTIRLTSHWSSFELVNSRFTNSASQQEVFPTDELFKFAFQEKLPIKWGS